MNLAVYYIFFIGGGIMAVLMLVLLITRISVYCEDCCDIPFCSKRKRIKELNNMTRDILFSAEETIPPMGPPSDENITADIICQPYIYRDALNTGLSSVLLEIPVTVDRDPNEAMVIKSG